MTKNKVRFLLDADFIIYALAGDASATKWIAAVTGEVQISALALAQVEAGLTTDSAERVHLTAILSLFGVSPFDAGCARRYGLLTVAHGASRKHALDRMIAAQALVLDAALVTNNVRDFRGIDGLRIESWR